MALAGMLAEYRQDVICDLAETYHIYDYKGVPGRLLGTLVAGLGVNTRTKRKLYGIKEEVPDTLLLARILDDLEILKWWQSGSKKKNKPELITDFILGRSDDATQDLAKDAKRYKDGSAFNEARARLLGVK